MEPQNNFSILFRVKAKSGKQKDLAEFLKWDCQSSEKEDGTLRFDAWKDPADQDAFYVYEAYRDLGAFEKHKEGEPFLKWKNEVEPKWIAEKWVLFAGEPICLLGREGEK